MFHELIVQVINEIIDQLFTGIINSLNIVIH